MSAPQERAHPRLQGRIIIATHNAGKLVEMRDLLAPYGLDAVSAGELNLEEPEETGLTFMENALAPHQRKAWFISALTVAWPDGHLAEVEGRIDGQLVWPPRGNQGFGYDPMFLPDGETRTFGELSREEKHGLPPLGRGLSHRARAFIALVDQVLT